MPAKLTQHVTDLQLPYERFLNFGPENLTEAELLAVILRTGTKDTSAVELAEKVLALAKYPREGLLGLHDVSVEELTQIRGIGIGGKAVVGIRRMPAAAFSFFLS